MSTVKLWIGDFLSRLANKYGREKITVVMNKKGRDKLVSPNNKTILDFMDEGGLGFDNPNWMAEWDKRRDAARPAYMEYLKEQGKSRRKLIVKSLK